MLDYFRFAHHPEAWEISGRAGSEKIGMICLTDSPSTQLRRAVLAPMPRPVRTASGDILAAPLVLVDVQTNEGIVGRSYAFAYNPLMLRSLVQFLRDVAPDLVGKAVSPRERMRQLEKRLTLVGWQGVAGMAVGALDMALWDALGRAANLPVAVLLGAEVKSLDAYDSYGILDIKTDLAWIEASIESGFEAIKIKLGAGEVANDVAVVAAVRKLIGPKVRLMIDFNQSQTTASAIDRILRLQEFDLTWVEEPVAADDLQGHRAVREAVHPVLIQTGENWWFPRGMANAIAARASDLAMIDIMKIGGVTGWISAAGQAEAASLPLSNHTFIEASAHTMAASPTASWFEYLDLAGAVLTERLLPNKGKVVPRGPGLGLEWDEKAVHKLAFE
jgi:mandelate racemase